MRFYCYPLLMGMGWALAYHLAKAKTELSLKKFRNLFILLFSSSWIGAKLLFLVTISNETKDNLALSENFWLGGGFVFYGGFLFSGFIIFLLIHYFKILALRDLNALVPGLAWGHALGRIGCLLAGCCYGIPYNGLMSVVIHAHHTFPVQLLEAVLLAILGTWFWYNPNNSRLKYLFTYSGARFFLEFLRDDQVRGSYLGLSTSQIISLGIMSILLLGYLITKLRRLRFH